jgi:hypothetical protein
MKIVKIGLVVVVSLVMLAAIGLAGYKLIYSQGIAEAFEMNSPELETRVLIATQGSAFKDAVVDNVTETLVQKPVYIKIIDVTALPDIQTDQWSALVFITTCQSSELQKDVQTALKQVKTLENVVLLTTSGSGTWAPEEFAFDSISSASRKHKIQPLATEILKRLDEILEIA